MILYSECLFISLIPFRSSFSAPTSDINVMVDDPQRTGIHIYHFYIPSASQLHLYAEQSVHLTEHNGKMWTFFSFLLPFDLREFAAHDSGLFKRWSSFWRNLNLASAAICHWHYSVDSAFVSFFLSFSLKVRRRARIIEVKLAVPWCRHTIARVKYKYNKRERDTAQIQSKRPYIRNAVELCEWGLAYR